MQPQGTQCLYIWGQKMTKFKKYKKVTKNKARIIWKAHAHLQTMEKTCAKFQRDKYKIVWVVLTRCPLSPLSIYWGWKMTKFTMWKKVKKKNNLTITSKQHAHPHTMRKTHAKFYNNRYKTVRGVVLTRGTNCLYIKGEKWLSSQCGKSENNLTIMSKPHAHPHTMKKTYAKFQNDRYKTVRGVVLKFTMWKKWQKMF